MAYQESKHAFTWSDMEYLIALHSPDHLFHGSRPIGIDAYERRLTLAMGLSAQNTASNRHSDRSISSRGFEKAIRQHRQNAISSSLLSTHYKSFQIGSLEPDLGPLQLLISIQRRSPQITPMKYEARSAYFVPLLDVLCQVIVGDARHLRFDYFSMHRRCWQLLENLQQNMQGFLKDLSRMMGEDLLSQEPITLRCIPGYIFQYASVIATAGAKRTAVAGFLSQPISIVQRLAQKEGSVELDKVSRPSTQTSQDRSLGKFKNTLRQDCIGEDESDDGEELALVEMMLGMAPGSNATPAMAKMALKLTKNTPRNELPPASQALHAMLQDHKQGGGSNDVLGGRMALHDINSKLTPEEQEAVMKTTTLAEYVEHCQSMLKGTVEPTKKKRNNKNKNKNRKARQEEQAQCVLETANSSSVEG